MRNSSPRRPASGRVTTPRAAKYSAGTANTTPSSRPHMRWLYSILHNIQCRACKDWTTYFKDACIPTLQSPQLPVWLESRLHAPSDSEWEYAHQ